MENSQTLGRMDSSVARQRVVTDLKTLSHDAEDLLKATAGDMSEKTRAARQRLGVALERAKATYVNLQDRTVAAAKKADVVIRDHPYQFIGVSFGIGLLAGLLIARK